MERTLVLAKPDAVQRGLIGEIIGRLERRGLKMIAAKLVHVSQQMAETHYQVHQGEPFYAGLIEYITSSPVLATVWEGPNAIAVVRQMMGTTDPQQAPPGSVRHDFSLEIGRNLTHASDGPDTALAEIALWFDPSELKSWKRDTDRWIYEESSNS